MFSIPLHPAIVHLPIGIGLIMPIIVALLFWGEKRGFLTAKSWWIGIALQLTVALGALLAMKLGESDEEKVEKFVSEALIKHHEEWAEIFVWGAFITLALMVAATLPRLRLLKPLPLIASLALIVPLFQAGHSGGELVYRHGAAQAHIQSASTSDMQEFPHRETQDHDD